MAYNSGPSRVNMSEYISTLNHVPDQDMAASTEFLEDDLAMFTNANFFDFDLGQDADLQPTDYNGDGRRDQAVAPDAVDLKSLDFMSGDYQFPDFNSFPPTTFTDTTIPPAPINTSLPLYGSSNAGSPPQSANPSSSGTKRKAESISHSLADSPSGNDEDSARNAAEEDKRRRNTAASARFRVKKKQREQALERSAKDMSDKVAALEGRINQLETENKWLKNLITERNESKEDIAGLYKKYAENAERKASERKDGVGTSA